MFCYFAVVNTKHNKYWLHSNLKNKPDPYVDKLFDKVQTEIMKKAMKKDLRRKKDA